MVNLINKIAVWLSKHKWLYYILNFTWGSILTVVGFLMILGLLIAGKKPEIYYGCFRFKIGKSWGGFSIGLLIVTDNNSSDNVSLHEVGHTYQNAILGPLMIFLVSIPSMVRYWYRELKYYRKGLAPKTKYDDIWFEGSATKIGAIIGLNTKFGK